jgi:hypothetical protein
LSPDSNTEGLGKKLSFLEQTDSKRACFFEQRGSFSNLTASEPGAMLSTLSNGASALEAKPEQVEAEDVRKPKNACRVRSIGFRVSTNIATVPPANGAFSFPRQKGIKERTDGPQVEVEAKVPLSAAKKAKLPEVARLRNKMHDQSCILAGADFGAPVPTQKRFHRKLAESLG